MTTALGEQSCGCLLIEKAQKEPDEYAQAAYREAGIEAQRKWGCPVGGFKPKDSLTPEQEDSIQAVSNLTGVDFKDGCAGCTCPRADLYFTDAYGNTNQVAKDTERVIKARIWRDKGQLQLIAGQDPANTLVEGINVLDEAFNKREHYDAIKQKEKMEREQKKWEESNPTVRERFRG